MDGRTTSCARVEVLEPGGEGAPWIERLSTQPHVWFLAQDIEGGPRGARERSDTAGDRKSTTGHLSKSNTNFEKAV